MDYTELLQQIEERAFVEKNESKRFLLLQDIGNAYFKVGNYSKALDYYYLALEIARNVNERKLELDILINIGSCLYNLDKFHDAISLYQEALTIARDLQDYRVQNIILGKLADAYLRLGEDNQAIEYFHQGATTKSEQADQSTVVYGGRIEAWKRIVSLQKLEISQAIIISILAILAIALLTGGLILFLQTVRNIDATSGILLTAVGILTSFVSGLLGFFTARKLFKKR